MEKTKVIIQDVVFLEPVTALTDFAITALCVYFFIKLKKNEEGSRRNDLWKRFFLFVGLSSFLGGVAHLFFYYLEGHPHKTIWLGMNITSAVSVYFAELSAIELLIVRSKKWYSTVAVLLVFTFTALSLILQNFNISKINMGIGLIFILITHIITSRRGVDGSWFVVCGIILAIAPVAIHSFKWSLNKWFNFNDISHIFMMGSLYLIYRGAAQFNLNDAEAALSERVPVNYANS